MQGEMGKWNKDNGRRREWQWPFVELGKLPHTIPLCHDVSGRDQSGSKQSKDSRVNLEYGAIATSLGGY